MSHQTHASAGHGATMTEMEFKAGRRQLMVHDGVAFLVLTAVTGVLFAVTLFLFRSFSAHRVELAHRYSARGRVALGQGRPKDAIDAFRMALSYAPGVRDDELLLAQALGDDGRLEEANNYFLNLWETQPGDAPINLQLARLARRRNERQTAVDYYRGAIYGNWNGDGTTHRREVRLELADYLVEGKQLAAAQAELEIAASNAPPVATVQIALGDGLLRAGDPQAALREYQKAFAEDPRNELAYEKAGRVAYRQGDYGRARDWLEQALRESPESPDATTDSKNDLDGLLRNAERLLLLDPSRATSNADRVTRLLDERTLARKRLDACAKQSMALDLVPEEQASLTSRWAASKSVSRAALLHDPAAAVTLQGLIDDTERFAATSCGPPQGDDALILLLANRGATP